MEWFGKKARDIITGFKGTAIGYCQYNTSCSQILISPKVTKDGSLREAHWFDEQRVRFLKGNKIKVKNVTDNLGSDISAPIK